EHALDRRLAQSDALRQLAVGKPARAQAALEGVDQIDGYAHGGRWRRGGCPASHRDEGRAQMLDVGFELLLRHARLVQLQVELEEADIGSVGEARAVQRVLAPESGLAEGGSQVVE